MKLYATNFSTVFPAFAEALATEVEIQLSNHVESRTISSDDFPDISDHPWYVSEYATVRDHISVYGLELDVAIIKDDTLVPVSLHGVISSDYIDTEDTPFPILGAKKHVTERYAVNFEYKFKEDDLWVYMANDERCDMSGKELLFKGDLDKYLEIFRCSILSLIPQIDPFMLSHQDDYILIGENYDTDAHGLLLWITDVVNWDWRADTGIFARILKYYNENNYITGVQNMVRFVLRAGRVLEDGGPMEFHFQHSLKTITYQPKCVDGYNKIIFIFGDGEADYYDFRTNIDPSLIMRRMIKWFIVEMNFALSDGKYCKDAFTIRYVPDSAAVDPDEGKPVDIFPFDQFEIFVFEEEDD